MKNKIVLIDPTSPEFNRGSFCYLPHLFYAFFKESGHDIYFAENFILEDIDKLPKADTYYVAVWSYPQIEAAKVLQKYLPTPPVFFGYTPFLEEEGLSPIISLHEVQLVEALSCYYKYYHDFKSILLSDCDMHLKKYSGQVYPLFTSYGCPRGCAFCPVSVNCHNKRATVDLPTVFSILSELASKGITNIHFTDEDFFFDIDRAAKILTHATNIGGFNFISLGSVDRVLLFQKKYPGLMSSSGMRLIEVGLESGDSALGEQMGKPAIEKYIELAENHETDIFWLAMTFFPGETISSLNTTGRFLHNYGFKMEELYGRIRTNGTEGGLGQFFQPYPKTPSFADLKNLGISVSPRPIRLMPSFIPHSFLQSRYKVNRKIQEEDIKWFKLYRVPIPPLWDADTVYVVEDTIQETTQRTAISMADVAVGLAIAARLQLIKGRSKNAHNQHTNRTVGGKVFY